MSEGPRGPALSEFLRQLRCWFSFAGIASYEASKFSWQAGDCDGKSR
jgi:hypothetical protein